MIFARIKKIEAREILDSRGNPTMEVSVTAGKFMGTAAVPSGASTGRHEALELRDGGKRYLGKGVKKAIGNVEKKIAPLLIGKNCRKQIEIDQLMIKLDGTKNKSKLGANAMLAVSLACARVAASSMKEPLYRYLGRLSSVNAAGLPRPFFNVINGGKHADNKLSFQEFMISPRKKTFSENLRVASEVYHVLKKELQNKYGPGSTNVGDEGGFATLKLRNAEEALDVLLLAIRKAGYKDQVDLALDCAASEFYSRGKYLVDGRKISRDGLLKLYLKLIKNYPIISVEDPFHQEDFSGFAELQKKVRIYVVGDDLTATNLSRVQKAVEMKSMNCLLLKVNQVGTLTEALAAAELMFMHNLNVMVSHRSGETEDTFIADLAVALGCSMIKSGAPCRGERTAKYNRLLRIEGELIN